MAHDEVLTLRDILTTRLENARLVVLSACQTGVPGTELPDEVISLPAGLMQAGAGGVVASLWLVADLSTMMLMVRFYELWKGDGLEPAEALRQAQFWVRDTSNGEKAQYFKGFLPEFQGERITDKKCFMAAEGNILLAGMKIDRHGLGTGQGNISFVQVNGLCIILFPENQHMAAHMIAKINIQPELKGTQNNITGSLAGLPACGGIRSFVTGLNLEQTADGNSVKPVKQRRVPAGCFFQYLNTF